MLLQQKIGDVGTDDGLRKRKKDGILSILNKYFASKLFVTASVYPILSAKQHNEFPKQASRISVQEVVVTGTLQSFVLGELDYVHFMSLPSKNT